MSGSNGLSAAARLHVVNPSDDIKSRSPPPARERGQAKAKGKGKAEGMGKGNGKGKGKGKGKGQGRPGGNHVRDGSDSLAPMSASASAPAREPASSQEADDHWDDLRRAWAGELSQGKNGGGGGEGSQGTHNHRNHTPNNHHHHHHPDGKRPKSNSVQSRRNRGGGGGGGGGGSQGNHNHNHTSNNHHHHNRSDGQRPVSVFVQSRRGRGGGGGGSGGGHVHAGQKRKATATNSNTNGTADDDDGSAFKRHKGDERRPSAGPSGARPHPDFWHPDGSVIVEVEKTKFRLHQSTLQKHSAYFAAAFRERKGVDQQQQQRGSGGRAADLEVEVDERNSNGQLPLYRVSETTAEDFTMLLNVIEEPITYADETPPMPVLAGVLRAARALSFDAQRKWAERIFDRMWPATLDTLTADPIPHAAVALALARTCGLRSVQKRASYELIRMPTFGQTVITASVAIGKRRDVDTGLGMDELPRADLLRLLHAREQLCLAWAEVAGKAPTEFACPRGTQMQMPPERSGGSSSSNGGVCASANVDRVHARWAELIHTSGLYAQRMVDPLTGLQELVGISWKDEGFCKKCVAARKNAWDVLRGRLWDDLDVWLELSLTAE